MNASIRLKYVILLHDNPKLPFFTSFQKIKKRKKRRNTKLRIGKREVSKKSTTFFGFRNPTGGPVAP